MTNFSPNLNPYLEDLGNNGNSNACYAERDSAIDTKQAIQLQSGRFTGRWLTAVVLGFSCARARRINI
jgi:hypothetical protein